MQTKCSLRYAAVASSSNDSCAITWHQWQAAYPTLSSTGTPRSRASANASSPHSHQSTGLSACWRRYGEVAPARRFGTTRRYPRVPGTMRFDLVRDACPMAFHGQVVTREWLTPGLVRIVLGGPGLDGFEMPAATDTYVNVAIPPAGAPYDAVFEP